MPSNTEAWKAHLIRAAESFYSLSCSVNPEYGKIVTYHEDAFDAVNSKYIEYRERVHAILGGEFMDRHKILAAYVLALTDRDNLVFRINEDAARQSPLKEFPPWVMFPNEFYIYHLILPILTQFVLATKKSDALRLNDGNYDIRLPDRSVCWETGTTLPYVDHLIQLLFSLIHSDDIDTKYLLLQSNLTFFFELAYDCAVANINNIYFDKSGA